MRMMTVAEATERFWTHVDRSGGEESCWPWTGALKRGYGHLKFRGQYAPASRVSYRLTFGEIPEGLVIDHLCRTPICVNPTHLEAVTQRENLLRGVGFVATHARKTHCPQGHAYDEANTYVGPRNQRWCRRCLNDRQRARRARVR